MPLVLKGLHYLHYLSKSTCTVKWYLKGLPITGVKDKRIKHCLD